MGRRTAIDNPDTGRVSYDYDLAGNEKITPNQARQGVTLYVNQFFTERNGSVGSKHVFVGTTRLVTKVTGGTNFIRSYDGYTESKTPPGQLKQVDRPGKDRPRKDPPAKDQPDHSDNGKHLGQQKSAATPTQGSHPGQGIYRRSDRANAVAQNTCKNKHLAADHCAEEGAGGDTTSTSTDTTTSTSLTEPGTSPDEVAVFEISPPDLFDEDSSAAYAELIKVSMGEQLFYYHPDHLGSTSYVTRENGKIHEHIQYFPFGETWIQQGGNTEKSPYLFTSKELDEETGLYYYGARYYDPRTSVWVSVDPILGKYLPTGNKKRDRQLPGMGGIFNSPNLALYTYTHLNPVRLTDPDGNAVSVTVNGNDVTIDIAVKYHGPGITPALQAQFDKAVAATWTGSHGQYNVTVNVTSVIDNSIPGFSEDDSYSDYTPVHVAKGKGDAFVIAKSSAFLYEKDTDLTVAHEFGHLFGLDDRYTEQTDSAGKRKTTPHPGWEGNIMAACRGVEHG